MRKETAELVQEWGNARQQGLPCCAGTDSTPLSHHLTAPTWSQLLPTANRGQDTASSLGKALQSCGVFNITAGETLIPLKAMPKLPLISMEQVFSPSHRLPDQISAPFVTHSIFLKLF